MDNKLNNPFAEHVLSVTGKSGFTPLNVAQLFALGQPRRPEGQETGGRRQQTEDQAILPSFFMFFS